VGNGALTWIVDIQATIQLFEIRVLSAFSKERLSIRYDFVPGTHLKAALLMKAASFILALAMQTIAFQQIF
jgi:hypothetical protein